MKSVFKKSTLSLALTASLLATGTWSGASYACSAEPIVSSVCIMASARNGNFNGNFAMASGTLMSVQQYTALYSLIASTYGSTQQGTNFNLPNLSGRVVVGAGLYNENGSTSVYQVGQKGGAMTSKGSVTLTSANLPAHLHSLTSSASGVLVTTAAGSLAVTLSGLTTTVTLGDMKASTAMTGVTGTASASASGATLAVNGSSATAINGTFGGAYFGSAGLNKIYAPTSSSLSPLGNGTLSGSLPVIFNGSPTTTLTGLPTVTVNGSGSLSGAPTVTIGGVTNVAGAAMPAPAAVSVPTMMPYLVLNYYIAINGIYPMYD